MKNVKNQVVSLYYSKKKDSYYVYVNKMVLFCMPSGVFDNLSFARIEYFAKYMFNHLNA